MHFRKPLVGGCLLRVPHSFAPFAEDPILLLQSGSWQLEQMDSKRRGGNLHSVSVAYPKATAMWPRLSSAPAPWCL